MGHSGCISYSVHVGPGATSHEHVGTPLGPRVTQWQSVSEGTGV